MRWNWQILFCAMLLRIKREAELPMSQQMVMLLYLPDRPPQSEVWIRDQAVPLTELSPGLSPPSIPVAGLPTTTYVCCQSTDGPSADDWSSAHGASVRRRPSSKYRHPATRSTSKSRDKAVLILVFQSFSEPYDRLATVAGINNSASRISATIEFRPTWKIRNGFLVSPFVCMCVPIDVLWLTTE